MSSHSSIQDRNDPSIRQEDGLIVLDIVKHALKTVILSLSPSDRLSIVAFDQAADLILPLCYLDPVSIRRAIDGVEALRPRGQTNLWGGIHQGFESLRKGSGPDPSPRSKTVMLPSLPIPLSSPPSSAFYDVWNALHLFAVYQH
jgi:hypothetical protein